MNECLIFFPRFGRTRVLDAAAALTPLAFGWGCQDGFVRDGCKVWGRFRVFSSPLTAQYAPNKQTNKKKVLHLCMALYSCFPLTRKT